MPGGSSSTPKYQKSKVVIKTGLIITDLNVKITYSGSIQFFVCADGSAETWEEVTNISTGVQVTHEFVVTGTEVKWYAVFGKGSSITEIRLKDVS